MKSIKIQLSKFKKIQGSLKFSSVTAFIYQILNVGLMYILHVMLARWMGSAEYGIYVFAMAISLILTIPAKLGFQTSVLRFIPEYIAKKEWSNLRGVLNGSWMLTLSIGILISLISSIVLMVLNSNDMLENYIPLLISVWMIPISALLNLQNSMAKAIRKINIAYIPNILKTIIIISFALLMIKNDYALKSEHILFISLVVLTIIMVLHFRTIISNYNKIVAKLKPVYKFNQWLRVSIPLLLISGFQIILNRSDVIMIGIFTESFKVGLFNVASRTANLVSFILVAINVVATPIYSSLFAKKDLVGLQKFVTKTARGIFWPSILLAFLMFLFSKDIFSIFGKEYLPATLPFYILIIGQLINAIAGPVGSILNMTGHHNKSLKVYGISAVINIILNTIFIPIYGILGAAFSTMITMVIWNVWLYLLVVKNLNIYPSAIKLKLKFKYFLR